MPASAMRRGLVLAMLVGLIAQIPGTGLAQGVSVAPTRIVLDGPTRAATVYLSNRSDRTETYRIDLVRYTMRDDGAIVPADSLGQEDELFADELIRFSPHRVVLPPGGSQTVRLLVHRPAGGGPLNAEYRTHLSVRSVPGVPTLAEVERPTELPPEYRDKVLVRPVASIETLVPIIVRFGRLEATVKISEPHLFRRGPGTEPRLDLVLERTGNRSLYGELTITYVDPRGKEARVSYVKGLAVYLPNTRREIRQNLDLEPGVRLNAGHLRVEFTELEVGGGNESATLEIPLGGATAN